MMLREPPRLATWLLKTFGCHSSSEALLGDLFERYQNQRRPVWYWRQVLVAVFENVSKETWGYFLCTVVLGWAGLFSIWFLLETFSGQPITLNRHACTFFWFISGTGSGSAVRLLAKQRKRPMIFLYAASVLLILIGFHPWPESQPVLYWIDTLVLTTSILLAAVPAPYAVRQTTTPAEENAG